MYRAANGRTSTCAWNKYYATERAYLSAIREAKRSFFQEDLPNMLVTNPRKFWQVINPRGISSIALVNENGETVDDDECANLFNTAFVSVFSYEPSLSFPSTVNDSTNVMSSVTFFADGILSLIDNLKLTSSAGVDNINSKVLKNTKHQCCLFVLAVLAVTLNWHHTT